MTALPDSWMPGSFPAPRRPIWASGFADRRLIVDEGSDTPRTKQFTERVTPFLGDLGGFVQAGGAGAATRLSYAGAASSFPETDVP
jgi:hypothetical protein